MIRLATRMPLHRFPWWKVLLHLPDSWSKS